MVKNDIYPTDIYTALSGTLECFTQLGINMNLHFGIAHNVIWSCENFVYICKHWNKTELCEWNMKVDKSLFPTPKTLPSRIPMTTLIIYQLLLRFDVKNAIQWKPIVTVCLVTLCAWMYCASMYRYMANHPTKITFPCIFISEFDSSLLLKSGNFLLLTYSGLGWK